MSNEKSKKLFKLKTFDEIKNDKIYEIGIFSKKRPSKSKLPVPTTITSMPMINNEENVEDQVR